MSLRRVRPRKVERRRYELVGCFLVGFAVVESAEYGEAGSEEEQGECEVSELSVRKWHAKALRREGKEELTMDSGQLTTKTSVQEVEAVLRREKTENVPIEEYHALARRLAAEVDARDAVIAELLAMLELGEKPNCMDSKYNPASRVSIYDADRMLHDARRAGYARAVAIAEGRGNG